MKNVQARYSAHLIHPQDYALWSKGYIGIICLQVVQVTIDILALTSLVTKRHRELLMPWILWNGVVFVLLILSVVLIPLAVLWYFWIKATWHVFQSNFDRDLYSSSVRLTANNRVIGSKISATNTNSYSPYRRRPSIGQVDQDTGVIVQGYPATLQGPIHRLV